MNSKKLVVGVWSQLFSRIRMLEYFLVIIIFIYLLIVALIIFLGPWFYYLAGIPMGADFVNVFAAGVQVHQGAPHMAYNELAHHDVEESVASMPLHYLLMWNYPPPFLAVASLLALMPFLWAFAAYMGIGFVFYLAVTYCLSPRNRLSFWALAAFPAAFHNFMCGQNGYITTALFGAGFLCLEKRPWVAGIMFGLMSYKPQFFVLIPLALAVGRYGKALLSTLGTALGCALLSWLVYGSLAWQGFFHSVSGLTSGVFGTENSPEWNKFLSLFGWARMWGAELGTCYILQSIGVVICLLMVVWVWTSKTSLETRAATLCGAMFLATPYFLSYDLVLLAVPMALLVRQGMATGFIRYEKMLLVTFWILSSVMTELSYVGLPVTPLLLIGLMVLCFVRTRLSTQKQMVS